jgi:integrase
MKRDDDKTIVRLLAYGGLRIGEALALRRSNLDPVGHTLTIRESAGEVHGRLDVGPTKTYAVRTITLPTSLSVTHRCRRQRQGCSAASGVTHR